MGTSRCRVQVRRIEDVPGRQNHRWRACSPATGAWLLHDPDLRRCIECDRKGKGTYLCHAGLVDFASPITLDDGRVLKIENLYLAQGQMPPILCSANLPGGDEYNTDAVAAYQSRIKALC